MLERPFSAPTKEATVYSLPEQIILLCFLGVATVLGWHSLVDPDLGWHLASGLWILDQKSAPQIDPFGAQRSFFLCYSWLFEIVVAFIWKLGGFQALQVFQLFLILGSAALIVDLVKVSVSQAQLSALDSVIVQALTLGLTLPLVAPLWHLRPQLVSAMLLSFVLRQAVLGKLNFRFLAPIAIVWANLHVYWVFVPAVFLFIKAIGELNCGLRNCLKHFMQFLGLVSLGLVNPYGIELYRAMWIYAFDHHAANILIREFQPLSLDLGYAPYLTTLIIAAVLYRWRTFRRDLNLGWICLFIVLAVAACIRFKYLPLFVLFSAVPLARSVLPSFLRIITRERKDSETELKFTNSLIGSLVAFAIVLGVMVEDVPPLTQENIELMTIAKLTTKKCESHGQLNVLNHFDEGGWLALGYFLSKLPSRSESACKVTIDGRTLVMGAKRLQEFDDLRRGRIGCELVERWDSDIIVMPLRDGTEPVINLACDGFVPTLGAGRHVVLHHSSVG